MVDLGLMSDSLEVSDVEGQPLKQFSDGRLRGCGVRVSEWFKVER